MCCFGPLLMKFCEIAEEWSWKGRFYVYHCQWSCNGCLYDDHCCRSWNNWICVDLWWWFCNNWISVDLQWWSCKCCIIVVQNCCCIVGDEWSCNEFFFLFLSLYFFLTPGLTVCCHWVCLLALSLGCWMAWLAQLVPKLMMCRHD